MVIAKAPGLCLVLVVSCCIDNSNEKLRVLTGQRIHSRESWKQELPVVLIWTSWGVRGV